MTRFRSAGLLARFAVLATAFSFVAAVGAADDPKKGETAQTDPKKNADDAKPEDPIPENATPKELAAIIEKESKRRPMSVADLKKMLDVIERASDRLLASKEADDESALLAVRSKLRVYNTLTRFGDDDAADKLAAFAESLKNDKRPGIAPLIAGELLRGRIAKVSELKEDGRRQLVDDVIAQVKTGPITIDSLRLALQAANAIEDAVEGEEAALVYERIAPVLAKSEDERVVGYASKLEGVARRLRLPGNPIQIEGKTHDGSPFDWKQYQGKVVLVDFWATWCGPCIAELPNLKKNYEKYHDRGFEVVGISLDENAERLKEFLKDREIKWLTLFGAGEEQRGWEHPMAVRYGIMGIPTVILVDQEGKVVSLNARGPELGRLLEKLLGPVEEKKPADKPVSNE